MHYGWECDYSGCENRSSLSERLFMPYRATKHWYINPIAAYVMRGWSGSVERGDQRLFNFPTSWRGKWWRFHYLGDPGSVRVVDVRQRPATSFTLLWRVVGEVLLTRVTLTRVVDSVARPGATPMRRLEAIFQYLWTRKGPTPTQGTMQTSMFEAKVAVPDATYSFFMLFVEFLRNVKVASFTKKRCWCTCIRIHQLNRNPIDT
jgi:hypothetical protein